MKKYSLLFIFLPFILINCNKDKINESLNNNPPKTPETVCYDINDDSIDDFQIDYRWFTWDGVRSSGNSISGVIEPLNENSILLKKDDNTLFNELNDTIKLEIDEPYYWEANMHPELVSISNSSFTDFLWPSEWGIQSNKTLDSYYLGIKINDNNNQLIGWLKLKIDKHSGTIQLLDNKFKTTSYIIIDK